MIKCNFEKHLGGNIRCLLQQALNLSEWLSGGVLGQKLTDGISAPLHVVDSVLVWPGDAIGFNSVNFLHQSVCLVSEVSYDHIPFSKALVTAFTVWEFTKVTSSTSVTAGARHTLHTHTMSCGFVTLLLSNSSGVAVTCWKHTHIFRPYKTRTNIIKAQYYFVLFV